MSRKYTREEIRERFVGIIHDLVKYWENVPNPHGSRESGVAFSILVLLDGQNAAMPGFVVAPMPDPSDKQYAIDNGENYYPEAPHVKCDIAGGLHELFARLKDKEGNHA